MIAVFQNSFLHSHRAVRRREKSLIHPHYSLAEEVKKEEVTENILVPRIRPSIRKGISVEKFFASSYAFYIETYLFVIHSLLRYASDARTSIRRHFHVVVGRTNHANPPAIYKTFTSISTASRPTGPSSFCRIV